MKAKRFHHIAKGALHIVGYQLAFAFVGLLITPMFIASSAVVRVPFVGLVILAAIALVFIAGSQRGEVDCAKTEVLNRLLQKDGYVASGAELGSRYRRSNGVFSALLSSLPFVMIAGYVSATATVAAYFLQDLPPWLSGYLHRPEIGAPLHYAQNLAAVSTLTDYLRLATRFILFPFVCLFGEMSDELSFLFDRLTPIFMAVLPSAFAFGYQFGPARRKKAVLLIEKAKNTPRKRLKKAAKRQAPREKKQLI